MSIKFHFDLRFAFVLRPEAVRQIWKILDSGIGNVSATAKCADNSSREFTTASDLLEFDNARGKEILSLDIDARSDDRDRSSSVAFRNVGVYDNSISASLSAKEEGDISQMRDNLQAALDGTRVWYSAISRINLDYVLLGGLGIFCFVWLVAIIAVDNTASTRVDVPRGRAIILASQIVFYACSSFVAGWLIYRLHRRYFPRVMFAIGQGANRFDIDEKVRWAVIIAFIIFIFGSLVEAIVRGWIST